MHPPASTSIQPIVETIRSRWGDDALFLGAESARDQLVAAPDAPVDTSQHALLAPLAAHLRRGQLVEITGAPGSGKTSLAMALLAALLPAHGLATYVDTPRTFYPPSAAAIGLDLSRLWIARLHDWQATLAATEMLLDSGVVDVVLWDLVGSRETLSSGQLRRLRMAAVRHDATLLVLTTQPDRPGCRALDSGATVRLRVRRQALLWEEWGAQRVLDGYQLQIEIGRAPGKPHASPIDLMLGGQRSAARCGRVRGARPPLAADRCLPASAHPGCAQ